MSHLLFSLLQPQGKPVQGAMVSATRTSFISLTNALEKTEERDFRARRADTIAAGIHRRKWCNASAGNHPVNCCIVLRKVQKGQVLQAKMSLISAAELNESGARCLSKHSDMEDRMGGNLIYYAIVFLIIAIVAAALGFGGVAGTAISGAHLLLLVAVVFIVVGLLASVLRRGV